MSELPIPKFSMGQTVYYPGTTSVIERLTCPDCLGSQQWKVTTPAGTEMVTDCQRCAGHSRIADLPRPERRVYKPTVTKLTVGKISASTQPEWGDEDLVRYMCSETGIGSGSVYSESHLFTTETEAMAAAEIKAAERSAKVADEPQAMAAGRLQYLTVKDADLKQTWSERWDAWYSYRRLKEVMSETLSDESLSDKDKIEALESENDFNTRHADLPAIGKAINQIRGLLPDTDEAKEALAVLMPRRLTEAEVPFLADLVA
jgi:hypothetical protein